VAPLCCTHADWPESNIALETSINKDAPFAAGFLEKNQIFINVPECSGHAGFLDICIPALSGKILTR